MKNIQIDTKHVVTISNSLSEAQYRLELNEQRLVLAIISKILNKPKKDEYQELSADTIYTVGIAEFANMFNMTVKHATEILPVTVNNLYEQSIVIPQIGTKDIKFRWIRYREIDKTTGEVGIKWTDEIIPLISMLKGNFNSYLLAAIAELGSWYSLRLFMLINTSRRLKHKTVKYSVEQLREIFCLGSKYETFGDFSTYVLRPALTELNTKSDLRVVMTLNKVGKRVVGVTFTIVEIINLVEFKQQQAKEAAKLENKDAN